MLGKIVPWEQALYRGTLAESRSLEILKAPNFALPAEELVVLPFPSVASSLDMVKVKLLSSKAFFLENTSSEVSPETLLPLFSGNHMKLSPIIGLLLE